MHPLSAARASPLPSCEALPASCRGSERVCPCVCSVHVRVGVRVSVRVPACISASVSLCGILCSLVRAGLGFCFIVLRECSSPGCAFVLTAEPATAYVGAFAPCMCVRVCGCPYEFMRAHRRLPRYVVSCVNLCNPVLVPVSLCLVSSRLRRMLLSCSLVMILLSLPTCT